MKKGGIILRISPNGCDSDSDSDNDSASPPTLFNREDEPDVNKDIKFPEKGTRGEKMEIEIEGDILDYEKTLVYSLYQNKPVLKTFHYKRIVNLPYFLNKIYRDIE